MSFQFLKNCRKVVCIGRNYAEHIKELNNYTPKEPFFFLKPTSSIITPPHSSNVNDSTSDTFQPLKEDGSRPSAILIPKNVNVHHEIELALILKKQISNVSQLTTLELINSIEGVALAIDLTARNIQSDVKKVGLPWTMAKGMDTFCPISGMIPITDLPNLDPNTFQDEFHLLLSVNGVKRQDGNTTLMLTKMNVMLQKISEMMTLEAGDIVLTGTPAGVGNLQVGDIVTGQLSYKGKLLTDFEFPCEEKPGSYIYKPS